MPGRRSTIDGNEAAASVAYRTSEVIAIDNRTAMPQDRPGTVTPAADLTLERAVVAPGCAANFTMATGLVSACVTMQFAPGDVSFDVTFTLLPDTLDLRLFTDLVRGRLENGNVPRIPPQRFGLQLDYKTGPWAGYFSLIRAMRQDRVAELETATPGYTLADAELSYRISRSKSNHYTIFVQGKNLLDKEIRMHSSYQKDVAPLPGRALVIGVRGVF